MLIVFEGIDGCGKQTQAERLVSRMVENWRKDPWHNQVMTYNFPAYESTYFGGCIRKYLDGKMGQLYENHPLLVALLYAGDRFECREQLMHSIASAGAKGRPIVVDRYVHSNAAYQGAKLQDAEAQLQLAAQIEHIEFQVFKMPQPDLVIYLDISAAQSIARTGARSGAEVDIHESCQPYLERVRGVYHHYVRTFKAWQMVDCFVDGCERSVEELSCEIWDLVQCRRQQLEEDVTHG